MNFMVKDGSNGQMVVNMTELGKIIKCPDMVFWSIQMAKNTKDRLSTIKNKATVFLHGKTGDNMMVSGKLANRMVLQNI